LPAELATKKTLIVRNLISTTKNTQQSTWPAFAFCWRHFWWSLSSLAVWTVLKRLVNSRTLVCFGDFLFVCLRFVVWVVCLVLLTRFLIAVVLSSFLVALVLLLPTIDVTKWNYDTGYTYVLYAYAAYCPYETLNDWECKWCQYNETTRGFQPTGFFNDRATNTYGYAGYNPDLEQIIVSFRGTEVGSLKNWITDLKTSKLTPLKSYPNVTVHSVGWSVVTHVFFSCCCSSVACVLR
jgi:hypothetical protein